MRAVRLVEPCRPLVLQEIDTPEVAAGDLLVRVKAVGICHSDAHYRSGISPAGPLPLSLGHEVAGVIESIGDGVSGFKKGDRVALHYLVTCQECEHCRAGREQFCLAGQMIGKHRDGGYAEMIRLPARNAFRVPDNIPLEAAAIMMCSTATSMHALAKARLAAGETLAVFGVGGLGLSAVQLASLRDCGTLFAVDVNRKRLELAEQTGAVPIDAAACDPVAAILQKTDGRGVDVAIELVGLPETMHQAVRSLAVQGRAALVGLTDRSFEVEAYAELINKEAEIIGVSDHLATEIEQLLQTAADGSFDVSQWITERVPLEPDAINTVLDRLDHFGDGVRAVIVP